MNRRRAVTPKELVVVGFVLFVLFGGFILLRPGLGSRAVPPQLMCALNLKGIGTSAKIYANDNYGSWPEVSFDETAIGSIRYTGPIGNGEGTLRSPNRLQASLGGEGGATELSTTRAFWMLVRTGDITVVQFACPVSTDTSNGDMDLELYYDFAGYTDVSYGLQVPFGPKSTRAGAWADPRLAVAADKGPYRNGTLASPPISLTLADPERGGYSRKAKKAWRAFNSPNHKGEGQNVLFADGHVTFSRTPTVGIDYDNIYTASLGDDVPGGWTSGESPWVRNAHPREAFDDDGKPTVTKDTLIYP